MDATFGVPMRSEFGRLPTPQHTKSAKKRIFLFLDTFFAISHSMEANPRSNVMILCPKGN